MLKSLSLENFRCYEKYLVKFDHTTILVGPNGVGKTNILEAIYLISTGRSWRTSREGHLVRWEKDFAKVTAKINNSKEAIIEMVIQRAPTPDYPQLKIIKINGVKKRLIELLGKLPTVLFSPEEIQLIDGPPNLRRRFLDMILCQVDQKYTLALVDFFKVVRGRNKLLYYIKIGQSKIDELVFWDEKLVVLGSFIIKRRQKIIESLNQNLTKTYQTISGQKEDFKLKYKSTVLPANFQKTILEKRSSEIENTATLFGPHRDDLIFLLENRHLAAFGSRGEYRSAILALKIAELDYLKNQSEETPILLLDDIFSELDKNRRLHLAKIISGQQTIITTTDLDHIERGLKEKAKIIELK